MLETSRRALGPVISIIAVAFLLQFYFGTLPPGRLSHPGNSAERVLEFTFSTQEAMLDVVAATFAIFVVPVIIFGAFLESSGAGASLMNLGAALAGRAGEDRGVRLGAVRLDLGLVARQRRRRRRLHDSADEARGLAQP
jgi:TRAP-type uncharacterized transport system fused permease subunit